MFVIFSGLALIGIGFVAARTQSGRRFLRKHFSFLNFGKNSALKCVLIKFHRNEEELGYCDEFSKKLNSDLISTFFKKENISQFPQQENESLKLDDHLASLKINKSDMNFVIITFVNQYERLSDDYSNHLNRLEEDYSNFSLFMKF